MFRTSKFSLQKGNGYFIISIIIFFLGLTYGALLSSVNGNTEIFTSVLVSQYVTQTNAHGILIILWNAFYPTVMFLFVEYLLGFCAIASPIIICLPFIKGLSLGAFIAATYKNYSFLGVLFSLLIVIIPSVFTLFSIFIASRESFRLSILLFKCICMNDANVGREIIKRYHVKYGILLIIVLISALINTVLVFLFSGLIKL